MKIKPRDEDLNSTIAGAAEQRRRRQVHQEGVPGGESESGDTVSVGLAGVISSELNPTKLAAERREKIERLKELVKQGKYDVSSGDVAAAFLQEVTFDVMSGGQEKLFDPADK